MFGKIVKTVFLNKDARDAMDKRDAVLRRKAGADGPSGSASESLADAAANAERAAASEENLRDKANATDLDRETIREAIASAHREVMEQGDQPPDPVEKALTRSKAPKQEHDELVESAMLIYRQKQKVLDDLDPASKKKLRMMAQTVFGSQIKK